MFSPWVGKFPWRREWQPTPVFLPREPHGQRSLVGYSPWGHKRVGQHLVTENVHTHTHTHTHTQVDISSTWLKVKWSHLVVSDSLWPHGHNLLGSSVHGIFQARVLEWVAIFFSRGSSWPRDWTWVSCIAGRHFTIWATWEAPPWLNLTRYCQITVQFMLVPVVYKSSSCSILSSAMVLSNFFFSTHHWWSCLAIGWWHSGPWPQATNCQWGTLSEPIQPGVRGVMVIRIL